MHLNMHGFIGNLTVKQRVERIELYWPYFLGFGLPLTILSTQLFQISDC